MTLTTERLEECRNALANESAADAHALNFGWHELRKALDEIAAYRLSGLSTCVSELGLIVKESSGLV